MALTFEILILARNEAAKGLEDANRDIKRALGDVEQTTARTTTAIQRTSQATTQEFGALVRVTRGLSQELVGTLNPALGQTVQSLGAAATASRGFSGATAGLVAGLAIVAGAAAQYTRVLFETTEKQAALNLAARGFDGGSLRRSMEESAQAIETTRLRTEALQRIMQRPNVGAQFMSDLRGMLTDPAGQWEKAKAQLLEVGKSLGIVSRATEEQAEARARLARVLPVERELALAEAYVKQQQALGPLVATELQRATLTADLEAYQAAQEKIAQSLSNEATAAEAVFRINARIATERAQARGASAAELAEINAQLERNIDLLASQTLARFNALRLQREQGELDIRTRRLPPAGGGPDVSFARQELGATPEEIERSRKLGLELDERALTLQQERVGVAQQLNELALQREGLTATEREALEQAVSAERTRLRLKEAELEIDKQRLGGDARRVQVAEDRRNLIEAEGLMTRANLERRAFERTDFMAGVSKGFRDMAEDMESFGKQGERVIRQFTETTSSFFEDLLFSPIEKGWKKTLEEVPLALVKSTGRILTDMLARYAVGNLLSGISKAVPGVSGLIGAGGTGTVAAGAALFGVPATATGAQNLAALAGVGGPAQTNVANVVGQIPVSSLVSLINASPGAATALTAALAGGGTSAVDAAALGASLGMTATPAAPGLLSQLGSIIATAAPFIGVAGSALGLGFTIYSALQQNPTPTSVALSGVSGAIAGAGLAAGLSTLAAAGFFGASLAAAWPSFGTSLIIGAVAGAALGAGAGAMGKGQGPEAGKRAGQRAQIGNTIYNQMLQAMQSQPTPEAAMRVRLSPSQAMVGSILRRIGEYNVTGFVAKRPWEWPPDPSLVEPVINAIAAMGIASSEFSEGQGTGGGVGSVGELIAAFGEGDAARGGQRAADLFREFLDMQADHEAALKSAEQQTPFSYVEPGFAAGVGGLQVQTFLPISRLAEAQGRDINVAADLYRNMSPYIYEVILRRLIQVDRDHQVGAWDRRLFSGEL